MSIKVNENANLVTILRKTRESLKTFSRSTERVASGIRLDSAADDPGAIGQVTFNENVVRGITQELKSLNEGISIAQQTDLYLLRVEDVLVELKALAEQSSSSEYTDVDRLFLNREAESLIQVMDDLIVQAAAQGIVLDGSSQNLSVLNEPTIQIDSINLSPDEFGSEVRYESLRRGLFVSALADDSLLINDVDIRSTTSADDTLSTTYNSGSAIAKAKAINVASYATGVYAEAGATVIEGNRSISSITLTGLNYFSINGEVFTGFALEDLDATHTLQDAINAEREYTGVTAEVSSDGALVLTADDGRNIQIRYANQDVLAAIGVTDKAGDVPNLNGAVALADIDRDLQGEVQIPITEDFQSYAGSASIGGRFDASEDYIDFVAQIVTAGSFGSAQFRLDRDPASEVNAAEDYAFIEGNVDPNVTLGTFSDDFFAFGGTATAGGSYNEALDREYILTVTQAGTTDGDILAEFDVSTVQDGQVGSFTASANTDIAIAGTRTGEDVTIRLSSSPRVTTTSSSIDAAQAYDGIVSFGGSYNGGSDGVTTVEVVTSGRTQGTPQAEIKVFHDGVEVSGPTTVNGDQAIDIGNGQTITFASDTASFSAVTYAVAGTYDEIVTVNSDPNQYTGLGSGTYSVEVTQAGTTDEAQYIVKKDGVTVSASASTLNSGTLNVADGITFLMPASQPAIGLNSVTTTHGKDVVDHYQDYDGAGFNGTYDGTLGETTLEVRVKDEGRVLANTEDSNVKTDYAVLEYRFGADPFQGSLIAQQGDLAIDHGVNFQLATGSAESTLIDANTSQDYGSSYTLPALSVGGYDGSIRFDLDEAVFEYDEDVKIEFNTNQTIQIPDAGVNPDSLTINIVSENDNTILDTQQINPISGNTYEIVPGLEITLTNSQASSASLVADAGNNDQGVISIKPGGGYNGSSDNDALLFSFSNQTNVTVTRDSVGGNDGVSASIGTQEYNGIYGDQRITLQLGTDPVTNTTLLSTGDNGVDDLAPLSIGGTYSGVNAGDDIRIEYLNRISTSTTADTGNDDGNFSITTDLVGAQDINRSYTDLALDIEVSRYVDVVATDGNTDVSVVGTSNSTFFGTLVIQISGNNITLSATTNGVTSEETVKSNTLTNDILDLGADPILSNVFGGVDPGFDFDLSVALGQNQGGNTPRYDFSADYVREYSFTDQQSGQNLSNLTSSNGVFDLGQSPFTDTFFTQGDPGFDLVISQEDDAVDDIFTLNWTIEPTVAVYKSSGGAQQNLVEVAMSLNGDQSQGTIDLNQNIFDPIFDEGKPNITAIIDDPLNAVDDVYSIIGVSPTVSFSNGTDTVEGLALQSTYNLSDPSLSSLFTLGSPGNIVVNLANIEQAVDDRFLIDLESETDVYVSETDGSNSRLVTIENDGTIDLAQAAVTDLLSGTADPGFDLQVTDLDFGIDDEYTLLLSDTPQMSALTNEDVAHVNVHSLQVGDIFSVDLSDARFEVGDTLSVDVDSAHLEQGSIYTLNNQLGSFNVGDTLKVNSTHAFDPNLYTVESSTSIVNGLSIDFDQNGNFEIGDEVRFQVRGYTGDPIASGTYTYAISPTIFTVEITQTGDVDGGAQFQYTRADTGETVTGFNASTIATELDDGVQIAFDAGRLYAGDLFYVETFESLNQVFGGVVTLSAEADIKIDYKDLDTDNLLGRINYQGDLVQVDAPGTEDNSTSQVLRENKQRAIEQFNVSTQNKASTAIELATNAMNSLSAYRSKLLSTRSVIEQVINHYKDRKEMKEEQLASVLTTEAAVESPQLISSIRTLSSAEVLAPITQQAQNQSLLSLVQSSMTDLDFMKEMQQVNQENKSVYNVETSPTSLMMKLQEKQENEKNLLAVKEKPKSFLDTMKDKQEKKAQEKSEQDHSSQTFFDRIQENFMDSTLTSSGQKQAFRQFLDDADQQQNNALDRLRRMRKGS